MLAERLPPFGSVVGVPRGGLPLAEVLQPYRARSGPLLIVDDVCSTGSSMEEVRKQYEQHACFGAVVFARGSVVPDWITPLFRMTP
jgi:hypothetical protein